MSRYTPPRPPAALFWATPYHPSAPRAGAMADTPEAACALAFIAAGLMPIPGRECLVREMAAPVAAVNAGMPLDETGKHCCQSGPAMVYRRGESEWERAALNGHV